MDDLIPFAVFIIIALINLAKFLVEKSGKGKPAPPPAEGEKPQRKPAGLEAFFEDLASSFEPKPTPVADWPESVERPDYKQEMEEEEPYTPFFGEPPQEARPAAPPPPPEPVRVAEVRPEVPAMDPAVAVKSAMRAMPSMITDNSGLQITMPPLLRSNAGKIDYNLQDRAAFRKAIIAGIVFSAPRAYAGSFDNTVIR